MNDLLASGDYCRARKVQPLLSLFYSLSSIKPLLMVSIASPKAMVFVATREILYLIGTKVNAKQSDLRQSHQAVLEPQELLLETALCRYVE